MSKGCHNIIINGAPQSGKDEFVTLCKEVDCLNIIYSISSVDKVKEAAEILGWDGVKNAKNREFLHKLKELSDSYLDSSMKYMRRIISNLRFPCVAFFMIREPENIQKFEAEFSNTYTLLIRRPGDDEFSNSSDANVENFSYDFIIENNGTLEDLKEKAKEFMSNF